MSQPRLRRGVRPGRLPQMQPRRRDASGYVLILARWPEPEVDVRAALLHSLDLATAPPEEGGRT